MTQTVLARPAPAGVVLDPVERVRLQERLQDAWRSTVMELTDLAVRFHSAERDVRVGDIAAAGTRLADCRLQLAEIEAAMRRVEEGRFGSCEGCDGVIAFDDLLIAPQRRLCAGCSGSATVSVGWPEA